MSAVLGASPQPPLVKHVVDELFITTVVVCPETLLVLTSGRIACFYIPYVHHAPSSLIFQRPLHEVAGAEARGTTLWIRCHESETAAPPAATCTTTAVTGSVAPPLLHVECGHNTVSAQAATLIEAVVAKAAELLLPPQAPTAPAAL